MKKLFTPIFMGCLSVSFTMLPTGNSSTTTTGIGGKDPIIAVSGVDEATTIYNTIHLDELGLSREAFNYAWKGYQHLLEHKQISNEQYLTICDFSQSSASKRLYIIDVTNQQLIKQTWVAHGRNSGGEYATKFSNKPESLQSSLGFYVTQSTYTGKHGLSLRINGVDRGFNDNALERTIVIHGADYVNSDRAKKGVMMGRSWGCPAVSEKESAFVISTIKNGTCLFIYHPQKNYLLVSKILNG